jgi:GAF domain-containing protein
MKRNDKEAKYIRIFKQLEGLILQYPIAIARMATINALLYHKMDSFFWVGFYLLNDGHLIVGPYQGPLACIKLEKNKGVCWAAVNTQKTIVVPDVHKFPGHIACDPRSRSEIVVPLRNQPGEIIGVFDIDSRLSNNFDETDALGLEKIVSLVYK